MRRRGNFQDPDDRFMPYQENNYQTTGGGLMRCRNIGADPDGGFCQLLGKYRMEFPGWSSIKAYAHQNDHCPSVAPDFVRPEGC